MTPKTSRDCARSNELVSRRLRARLQTASGGDDAAPRGERNARVVVVALVMGRVGGGASTDELGVRCVDVGARDIDAVDRTMERRVDGGATFVFVSFRFVSFRDATRVSARTVNGCLRRRWCGLAVGRCIARARLVVLSGESLAFGGVF